MYQLVKSEKLPFQQALPKTAPAYRQIIMHQFQKLDAALTACDIYNDKADSSRHYILNKLGKEYYEGNWID